MSPATADRAKPDLGRRLRALRGDVKQLQLASALGVTVSAISNWENGTRLPRESHLNKYARFFCTTRSTDGSHPGLLPDSELNENEQRSLAELRRELNDLLAAARPAPVELAATHTVTGPLGDFWRFADGATVTIVSSQLPERDEEGSPLAQPESLDYAKLSAYADLDSLVELFGHIRATNPTTQVNYRLPRELIEDDYTTHLALLGGVDWNAATKRFMRLLRMPVRQVSGDKRLDEAYFEVDDGSKRLQFRPRREQSEWAPEHEDVALIYRGPNPLNTKRTLTICNGVFGRGTYGAVRALTDARFRNRNEKYLQQRFGVYEAWGIVTRVPVLGELAATPDLTLPHFRLYEWPSTLP